MRKQLINGEAPFDSILPEYGKRKLLMYASSFKELAATYTDTTGMTQEEDAVKDKQEYLWKRRLVENKYLMADHLKEMADIMTRVAQEAYHLIPIGERKEKQLFHALKEEGILAEDFALVEKEDGHKEVTVRMKTLKKSGVAVDEVGNLLSVLLNVRLIPGKNAPFFLSNEWAAYFYVEEPRYHVLTGVAKAVKEAEELSGDNYSFLETKDGSLTAVLSDGMGSGEKACQDSAAVVELMEKFLEAGFCEDTAVQMINGSLIAGAENHNMSTLDVCRIDLYTGECNFMKVGSAPSLIKRENLVEQISARNLPLGVFYQMDMETVVRNLMDGDYIILLSDGICDALSQGIGEEILPEMIGKISLKNPTEIANHILNFCIHQSRGRIRDDMTVMVIGIWENLY